MKMKKSNIILIIVALLYFAHTTANALMSQRAIERVIMQNHHTNK